MRSSGRMIALKIGRDLSRELARRAARCGMSPVFAARTSGLRAPVVAIAILDGARTQHRHAGLASRASLTLLAGFHGGQSVAVLDAITWAPGRSLERPVECRSAAMLGNDRSTPGVRTVARRQVLEMRLQHALTRDDLAVGSRLSQPPPTGTKATVAPATTRSAPSGAVTHRLAQSQVPTRPRCRPRTTIRGRGLQFLRCAMPQKGHVLLADSGRRMTEHGIAG